MAAYHFTAKIHSRAKGASAVRAAAYRAGARLRDDRTGTIEDYTRKGDVAETAILLPNGAPAWMGDRAALWNAVESRERRKDAQLAQEIELNLPRELSEEDNWQLITDFARQYLVNEGRVCDIAMHVHEAADGGMHPHAHILMPLREVMADGFGEKHPDCDWRKFLDRRDRLGELREIWADFARARAAELGIDLGPDWDHRSYTDRGIDIEGQPKLGGKAARLLREDTPSERTAEVLEAQRRNGERLLERPEIALEALTQRQSTFSEADLARWLHRHAADDQFAAVLAAARAQSVVVGVDDRGRERLSTQQMVDLERQMISDAQELSERRSHYVRPHQLASHLSDEQRDAAQQLLSSGDLACLVGFAGSGKSTMLSEVRAAFEAEGYTVRGAALSGIAAQNLTQSGISARTIASLSYAWDNGRDQLSRNDILVVDEAGMIGSRELANLIQTASAAGAKIILAGDPEQLQAIDAGAAFRAILDRTDAAELTEIRRQRVEWQQEATKELATGRTEEALARYEAAGAIIVASNEVEARKALVDRWHQDGAADPEKSQIMLAHSRADVRALNDEARERRRADGVLGTDFDVETSRGQRSFAEGDRLLFLRNDKTLDVRNGTLATIAGIENGCLSVRTDDGRTVEVNSSTYRDFDHGYAVTVHKSQGVTVDKAYVHAGTGFDRHLSYVACSRHREELVIARSDESLPQDNFGQVMSRERAKDTTLDYEPGVVTLDPAPELRPDATELERSLELMRQRNRERSRDRGITPF